MRTAIFSRGKQTVQAVREVALIEKIRSWLGRSVPPAPEGMGDDAAVVEPGPGKLLLAMDPVLYGRHFDDTAEPELVGAKLLKRNLSDIAAMGGTPDHALLGLVLGGNVSLSWLERFVCGLRDCARKYDVRIVGGDVAEGPKKSFQAQLALTGHAERPVPRQGGQIGDTLWVTGQLGGSMAGWHLKFRPRLAEGQWLATQTGLRGMIDVTDGLAADLPKLLPRGSVARLDLDKILVSPPGIEASRQSGRSVLAHALCDGEDYELAFVLDKSVDALAFAAKWRDATALDLACIGNIIPLHEGLEEYALLDAASGQPIEEINGYEHFGN